MSWISDMFKTTKTPSYNGLRPPTSQTGLYGGQDYYNQINNRSQGIGVGYGPDYTSYANPQIAQSHNAYTGYALPELKSELTATGRRAGSAGFQQLARSQSDQADKENSIMAQLMQRNAEASNADVNKAIEAKGSWVKNEAGLGENAANFDNDLYGQQTKNLQYDKGMNDQRTGNVIQAGYDLVSPMFTGGGSSLGAPSSGEFNSTFQGPGYSWKPTTNPAYTQQIINRRQMGVA